MNAMKLLGIFIVLSLLSLVACSKSTDQDPQENEEALKNLNETGMPIVGNKIEFDMFAGTNADADWNDMLIWNEYEEMTNIDLNWEQIKTDSLEEERNLSLGSGNVPDIFFYSQLSNVDIYKYGQQGTLLNLEDLIEEYAPNLTELMEDDPTIKKALTYPDGSIYAMPPIVDDEFLSFRITSRPWYKEDWLDELDMDTPETTDEFYDYLKGVKELDPLGDGEAVPYAGTNIDELVQFLQGVYGVANRGINNGPIDVDPDDEDKVRFFAKTDEYKEMLEYIHKLYEEGLIAENIFSMEASQFLANAQDGIYGSMLYYDAIDVEGEELGDVYASGSALEGPHGDKQFTKAFAPVTSTGSFAITNENPNPAAAVRWMDYFYSDEGAQLYYMGKEGETYKKTEDGELEYTDDILNPSGEESFEQAVSKKLSWVGNEIGIIKEEYFHGSEASDASLEAADKIEPYVPEIWPAFNYTNEENQVLSSTGSDINKYVDEMREKFIAGEEDFSEWDNYIETIEGMGLDEYMEIQQDAYDRYEES